MAYERKKVLSFTSFWGDTVSETLHHVPMRKSKKSWLFFTVLTCALSSSPLWWELSFYARAHPEKDKTQRKIVDYTEAIKKENPRGVMKTLHLKINRDASLKRKHDKYSYKQVWVKVLHGSSLKDDKSKGSRAIHPKPRPITVSWSMRQFHDFVACVTLMDKVILNRMWVCCRFLSVFSCGTLLWNVCVLFALRPYLLTKAEAEKSNKGKRQGVVVKVKTARPVSLHDRLEAVVWQWCKNFNF